MVQSFNVGIGLRYQYNTLCRILSTLARYFDSPDHKAVVKDVDLDWSTSA